MGMAANPEMQRPDSVEDVLGLRTGRGCGAVATVLAAVGGDAEICEAVGCMDCPGTVYVDDNCIIEEVGAVVIKVCP